jgi:hypothetical protein
MHFCTLKAASQKEEPLDSSRIRFAGQQGASRDSVSLLRSVTLLDFFELPSFVVDMDNCTVEVDRRRLPSTLDEAVRRRADFLQHRH